MGGISTQSLQLLLNRICPEGQVKSGVSVVAGDVPLVDVCTKETSVVGFAVLVETSVGLIGCMGVDDRDPIEEAAVDTES